MNKSLIDNAYHQLMFNKPSVYDIYNYPTLIVKKQNINYERIINTVGPFALSDFEDFRFIFADEHQWKKIVILEHQTDEILKQLILSYG